MTDPNAGFPTGNNSYGAPQPAQPASDANAAYQQPQYTAPQPEPQPQPEARPAAFCPNCGAKNNGEKFCPNCGVPLQ